MGSRTNERAGPLPPRWVIVVSSAVAAAILGDSLLYAVLPTVWPQLGLEIGMVGVLLSTNRFVRLISNPVAGWVVERAGMRRPFMLAVFAGAASTAAYALGLGFVVLMIARASWGICWSFLRLGGYLAALEAADARNRGYYLGFFNGVTRLGSFIAVFLGGLLTDVIGFVATVWLFTALSVAGGLAVLRERPSRQAGAPAVAPATTIDPAPLPQPAYRYLATLYATVFLHGLAVNGLVQATLGRWLQLNYGPMVPLLSLSLGVATLTGWLLAVRFLADVVLGPVAGHLSDRIGRRRLTLTAGLIEIGALFWLASTTDLSGLILATAILFTAGTTLQATLDGSVGDLVPTAQRARTLGWYTNWSDLGTATGPLVGYLAGQAIGLDTLYRLSAVLLLLSGIAYTIVFATPPRRQ